MPDDDTHAKLNHLRRSAADALEAYMGIHSSPICNREHKNIAALYFLTAQAKYTLACLEAKEGPILPYVEVEPKQGFGGKYG